MDIRLSKWQTDFLKHFDDPLVCAVTGISSGKSYILSLWLVLQCVRNERIRGICIAQNYKALTRVLFTEVKSRAQELGVGYEEHKSDCSIEFGNGSILFGYSAENPESLLGLTNISLLAIDEAAYVPVDIYNYAKDRMRGTAISRTRLISSPVNGPVQNWFSKVSTTCPTIRASALDNPFTSDQFKDELRLRYGEGTTLYRQQVLGEIFETTSVTALVGRHDLTIGSPTLKSPLYAGYDASGLGGDRDIVTLVSEEGLVGQYCITETETVSKATRIREILSTNAVSGLCYDATGGYGSGVGDILVAAGLSNVHGINFASAAFDNGKFPNARTEMYIGLRERLVRGFKISGGDDLLDELCATQMDINGRGQIQLVHKDIIRGILGRSPDSADSLALAVYCMEHYRKDANTSAGDIVDRYMKALGI